MKKFDTLLEGVFQRYQGGGFLTGDLVKLKEDILNSEWAKNKGTNTHDQVKKFLESGLNVRISAVKTLRPQVQTSIDQAQASDSYYADIALEMAPGMFTDYMEVPCEFLEYVDTGINLSPVSDEHKRDDEITIKPTDVEVKEEEGMPGTNNVTQTLDTDHDRKLRNKDETLPGATGADSYTAGYMS